MRSFHLMASTAAIALMADDGTAGAEAASTRKSVTISGENFEVELPYSDGDTINAAEASTLNQTLLENIRNNCAGKIKAAKEAYEKEHNGSADGFSLDSIQVPDPTIGSEGGAAEGATVSLRKSLQHYADTYQFGVRTIRNAEPVDPVEREARSIAREQLNALMKAQNVKRKDLEETAIEEALGILAKDPDILKEANRRVKAKTSIGGGALDLKSLLAGAKAAPAEEPEG